MPRLHGMIGLASDPHLHDRLHALEHDGAVEVLRIDEADIGRRRLGKSMNGAHAMLRRHLYDAAAPALRLPDPCRNTPN